jgi:multidrug efflux pump subunit AcrA (membrane-fusion protein)
MKKFFFRVLPVLLVALGVAVLVYLVKTKPGPEGGADEDQGRLVEAIQVKKVSHRMTVTAYGTSRAEREWTAIAEVKGRAVYVAPEFEVGEVFTADSLLVRIDPTDYQIAVQRFQAEVKTQRQRLLEIDQNEENLRDILSLRKRELELSQSELDRQKTLFQQGTSTQADLETTETSYVTQKIAYEQIENDLDLIPVKREAQEASLALAQAQLAQASRDLEKTEIHVPFRARCFTKTVEEDQFLAAGQALGSFVSMDTAEVIVPLEPRQIGVLALNHLGLEGDPLKPINGKIVPFWDQVEIPAEVIWEGAGLRRVWDAKVSRLASGLDPRTRSISVTLEVANPYKEVVPGKNPPLLPDMFVETRIHGGTLEGVMPLPRECLHDHQVYVIEEGKLAIRRIEIQGYEGDTAIVLSGIEEGDWVVYSDLVPAVEGMSLRYEPVENPVMTEPSETEAQG